ncbi:MAG: hypothetical protein BWZ07_02532 [Alphaproteobacteria bacterium ADurb.BinA280]|nr:MAG: hypothetical protein BWZ07_02532 [Alphaproteobacteria bacterium ADurb.BinA280]
MRAWRSDFRLGTAIVGGATAGKIDSVHRIVGAGGANAAAIRPVAILVGRTPVFRGADGQDVLAGTGRADGVGTRPGVARGEYEKHLLIAGFRRVRVT